MKVRLFIYGIAVPRQYRDLDGTGTVEKIPRFYGSTVVRYNTITDSVYVSVMMLK